MESVDLEMRNNGTEPDQQIDYTLVYLAVGIDLFVSVLAIPANILTIARIAHCRRYYIMVHQVILHLAVADILYIMVHPVGQSIWKLVTNFYGGNFLCKLYTFVMNMSRSEMTLLIVVISLDRASCIRSPRYRPTKLLLYGSWTLSCLCAVPSLITHEAQQFQYKNKNITQCTPAQWYGNSTWRRANVFVSMGLFYVSPVIIIIGSYAIIIATLRRWKTRNLHSSQGTVVQFRSSINSSSTESGRLNTSVGGRLSAPVRRPPLADRRWGLLTRAQRLILIMASSIVGSFLLLWTPFFVVNLMAEFSADKTHSRDVVWVYWLQGLNALVNPIIYGIFTRRRQGASAAHINHRLQEQRRHHQYALPHHHLLGEKIFEEQPPSGIAFHAENGRAAVH